MLSWKDPHPHGETCGQELAFRETRDTDNVPPFKDTHIIVLRNATKVQPRGEPSLSRGALARLRYVSSR